MTGLDFTSASYLGHRHAAADLGGWAGLTTGRPAALAEPRGSATLAAEVARRTGRAAGVLSASTLHALVDAVTVLTAPAAGRPVVALIDDAAYPIGRWALRVAGASKSVPVGHLDPDRVSRAVQELPRGTRPVLLVDGLCPDCGRLAPLPSLLAALAPRRGTLLVDDTQAFGVAGTDPHRSAPYGDGGGGSPARTGVPSSAPLVVVASAAKAYGAPLAVTTGPARFVARVREQGPSRTHASPPSAADLAALRHALDRDPVDGAAARLRLWGLAGAFRSALVGRGLPEPRGGRWPSQFVPLGERDPQRAASQLRAAGVRAVPVRARCGPTSGLAFLLTARHTAADVHAAADRLAGVLR